jgi:hypothetical protein
MPFFNADNPLATKLAFAKLSEDLMESPAARSEFQADPRAYVSKVYGVPPSEEDMAPLRDLRGLLADGCCCGGCGCKPKTLYISAINPALYGSPQ